MYSFIITCITGSYIALLLLVLLLLLLILHKEPCWEHALTVDQEETKTQKMQSTPSSLSALSTDNDNVIETEENVQQEKADRK